MTKPNNKSLNSNSKFIFICLFAFFLCGFFLTIVKLLKVEKQRANNTPHFLGTKLNKCGHSPKYKVIFLRRLLFLSSRTLFNIIP